MCWVPQKRWQCAPGRWEVFGAYTDTAGSAGSASAPNLRHVAICPNADGGRRQLVSGGCWHHPKTLMLAGARSSASDVPLLAPAVTVQQRVCMTSWMSEQCFWLLSLATRKTRRKLGRAKREAIGQGCTRYAAAASSAASVANFCWILAACASQRRSHADDAPSSFAASSCARQCRSELVRALVVLASALVSERTQRPATHFSYVCRSSSHPAAVSAVDTSARTPGQVAVRMAADVERDEQRRAVVAPSGGVSGIAARSPSARARALRRKALLAV